MAPGTAWSPTVTDCAGSNRIMAKWTSSLLQTEQYVASWMFSATQGHIVPTSLVRHDGGFLLGNLGQFAPGVPVPVGVRQVTSGGSIRPVPTGLTAVTGLAVNRGQIYALEAFTGFFAPTPDVANTGMVVRLNSRTITWEPVVTGLSFPTAMTFDGNGDLFISNKGFGQPTNTAGEIVKVALAASGSESHPLPPRAATACTGIAAGRGATAARAIATHCRQHLQLPDEILHRSTAANCVAQPVRGTADLGVQFGRSGLSLRRRSGRLHIHDHQHGDERPDQSAGRICTAERTGLRKRKQPGRYQSSHRIRRVVAGERTGRGGIDAVVGVRHGCRSLPIDERHVCRRQ